MGRARRADAAARAVARCEGRDVARAAAGAFGWIRSTRQRGVVANDRAGLEHLCRSVPRPPFAQERLRLRADGRVALELKQVWHDRTRELVFEPLEFLERPAAMTPRPEPTCSFATPAGPPCPVACASGRLRPG